MPVYLITFFPRCGESELRVSDVDTIAVSQDTVGAAIEAFVALGSEYTDESMMVRNFLTSYIAQKQARSQPKNEYDRALAQVIKDFDRLNISKAEIEDEAVTNFIKNNETALIKLLKSDVRASHWISIVTFQVTDTPLK